MMKKKQTNFSPQGIQKNFFLQYCTHTHCFRCFIFHGKKLLVKFLQALKSEQNGFQQNISEEKLQWLIVCLLSRFTTLEKQHCEFCKTIKSSDYFSNENLVSHSIVINSIHHTSHNINSENGLSNLNAKYNFHKYPRHFYYELQGITLMYFYT